MNMLQSSINKEGEEVDNRSLIITLVVIVVLVGLGFWYFNQVGSKPVPQPTPNSTLLQEETTQSSTESAAVGEIKEFNLENKGLTFTASEMKVKKGDRVKVTFTVKQGMHDFTLDEFGIQTKTMKVGESDTVEFVADKAGSFEYYCSVTGHRQAGMKGMLIVE